MLLILAHQYEARVSHQFNRMSYYLHPFRFVQLVVEALEEGNRTIKVNTPDYMYVMKALIDSLRHLVVAPA